MYSIQIRLYPNKSQINYLSRLFGCYRFVYNKLLETKKNAYEKDKTNLELKELSKLFYGTLRKENVFLQEHNTQILTQSIRELMVTFSRFYKGIKSDISVGFPKFKVKGTRQSSKFSTKAISKKNNYLSSNLTLTTQLKNVRFECSDEYRQILHDNKSKIKSAILVKSRTNKYFLSIVLDIPKTRALKKIDNTIGIDLGINTFVTTSNGQQFENLKLLRSFSKKLALLHRSHSRKEKGSKNREKSRLRIAKLYERIVNKKQNYLHSITNQLIDENQVIVMEDLNVKGMLKNHRLAKSIAELSLYEFKRQLLYKSEWYGRQVILVDRFFPSSKLCSDCGQKNENLTLKDREWSCTECGVIHNRDLNAAKNIRSEGLRILGLRKPEVTPVESSCSQDALRSRKKREQEPVLVQ